MLVCDEEGSVIRYSQYFPNNKINSTTLKAALTELAEKYGRPQKIKFFRSQMQTIITRAIREMGGIREVPTRQCTSLINWLNSRIEDVYSKEPGNERESQDRHSFQRHAPRGGKGGNANLDSCTNSCLNRTQAAVFLQDLREWRQSRNPLCSKLE